MSYKKLKRMNTLDDVLFNILSQESSAFQNYPFRQFYAHNKRDRNKESIKALKKPVEFAPAGVEPMD